jgi:probable lipoprotein NlpC
VPARNRHQPCYTETVPPSLAIVIIESWERVLQIRIIGLLLLSALIAACTPTRTAERAPGIPESVPAKFDFTNKHLVKQALYAQFDQWRAVKYKSGGMSKDGVDCSGFVYLTFNSRLGIKLPRSTDLQVGIGNPVSKQELVPGDLVFFRTGKSTRHVGIYLEDGKFLHASTDRGVTISRLNDIYWSKVYWKSIRINA